MALNTSLFANPEIFGAYQNDPRRGYAQALMRQGASTEPVRSPLEGLARALQGGVGGYFQGEARRDYEKQGEEYQKGLAAALQGGDVLKALSSSQSPYLQQMGLNAQVQRALKDPTETFAPLTDAEETQYGLDTSGTYQRGNLSGKIDTLTAPAVKRKPGETRDFIQGDQKITQEWDGEKWGPLGQGRAFAPPSQVNVNTKTESEFNKAFGKGEGEAAAALANEVGAGAQASLQNLDALRQAYAELQAAGGDVGMLASLQTKATQLMQAFGFDPKALGLPENAGPAEQINAISNQLALQMRNPSGGAGMPGAMSDADRSFLRDTVANLGNSPQGFNTKLEAAAKIKQRELEMSTLWNSGKYEQSQEGFRKFKQDWAAYAKANPLFDASATPDSQAPKGAPQPGVTEDGFRFKGGDPGDPANWEKVQ